jgi:hypothetical protein
MRALPHYSIGFGGFAKQRCQWRQISVPFNQGWQPSEPLNRLCVELPHGRRYRAAVGIDQTVAVILEARQM